MAENQERDDAIYALGLERMNTLRLERILEAMNAQLQAITEGDTNDRQEQDRGRAD